MSSVYTIVCISPTKRFCMGGNWCSYWTSWCHPFAWWAVAYRTVFARDVSPTVTLTWHACKYKVHKLHLRYILFVVFVLRISTLINSLVCCYNQFPLVNWLDVNIFVISEWYWNFFLYLQLYTSDLFTRTVNNKQSQVLEENVNFFVINAWHSRFLSNGIKKWLSWLDHRGSTVIMLNASSFRLKKLLFGRCIQKRGTLTDELLC